MADRVTEVSLYLKPTERPVILEVGAHTGEDTERFLQCFPEADMNCFEPDPRCCTIWNARGFPRNARLFEIAVGDKDEPIDLHLSEASVVSPATGIRGLVRSFFLRRRNVEPVSSLGQSSLAESTSKSDEYPWLIFPKAISVASSRLDSWRSRHLEKRTTIDLIWSDVQGAG